MTLKLDQISQIVGGQMHLHALDMVLVPNAVTVLLGATQAGKTSLMRAISGAHAVAAGHIQLDGQDLTRLTPFKRAQSGVAYVPQGRDIFPLLSVEENLQTGYSCLPPKDQQIPDHIYEMFPVLKKLLIDGTIMNINFIKKLIIIS